MLRVGIAIPGRANVVGTSDPLSIFGAASVLQWVRADLGITLGTGVSAWADQSGNGKHYTQATGANQPVYNATDATLNYLPTVEATANGQNLLSSLALPNPTVLPWSVLIVAKFNTAPGLQVLISSPTDARPFVYSTATGSQLNASGNGGDIANVTSVAAWSRLRVDFSNSPSDVNRVGSVVVTGNIVNGVGTAPTQRQIFTISGNFCRAKIFEIVYLNKVISAAEMSAYDAYVTAVTGGGVAV